METPLTRQSLLRMFTMLYFVQGVIQAYQLNFFKPHMNAAGIDAGRIGLVASLALVPFVLKFIYGIISDRYNLFGRGYRVPYMLIGLVGTALAFFGAYFVDPSANYGVLATAVLAATFMMALFDTTADALAVDVMEPEDHSVVQAYMTAGRAIGLIALSAVFGVMVDRIGYQEIFLVIAVLLLVPLWQVTRVREDSDRLPSQTFDWNAFAFLRQTRFMLFGLFLIGGWVVFQGIDGLVTFYLAEEFDASGSRSGHMERSRASAWWSAPSGWPRSFESSDIARPRSLLLAQFLPAVLVISALNTASAIVAFAVVWGVAVGLQWTTYATFSMDVTDHRIAGSMFAIFSVMANIGLGIGESAVSFTDTYDITTVFRFLAVANLLLVPLIIQVIKKFAEFEDQPIEVPT